MNSVSDSSSKFSDSLSEWLASENYTHCFFVAGGNIMHIIESFSRKMVMIPVINEIGAVICAEYFNEASALTNNKAVALVTAGPGLTNAVTGIYGAYLESRELLVIGGQVKSADLSRGKVRQNGIQEIDGIDLVRNITVRSARLENPITEKQFKNLIKFKNSERKGPIFLEICLDSQAQSTPISDLNLKVARTNIQKSNHPFNAESLKKALSLLNDSSRPTIILGSGIEISSTNELINEIERLQIPIFTSWNAADRISWEHPLYFGRPNNWGQRYSNLILQQSDLLIALGTRLGYQATGFNTQEFLPRGKIIQVDIDSSELDKGHPKIDLGISDDSVGVASEIFSKFLKPKESWLEWLQFALFIKSKVPIVDPLNTCSTQYVEIFQFIHKISEFIEKNDLIVAGSSGSGSTVTMQTIKQKGLPQRIITNKGLASMGYGLPGAIGASFSLCNRVWLFEGDGSFTQNLQELGVIAQFNLNITILIISNNGYASIRSTQRNYFSGNYIGCDDSTGLHMPKLNKIAGAYGIRFLRVKVGDQFSSEMLNELNKKGPLIIEIPVDPDQTYYPKIQSKIDAKLGMISNPIHNMTPELSQSDKISLLPYLNE